MMDMLKGKKIVLGITGSIAAYKSCLIIRELVKRGAEVQVVITPAGKEFITPITLSALTQKPVISEFFAQRDGTWHSHVKLGLWADAMLIAPCTASTLGKMANGIADNMLVTTYLSMKAPVFIAPAMDLDMYQHPTTQQNMERLRSFGNHIIEPQSGFLASGLEGKGRMEEPDRIVEYLENALCKKEDGRCNLAGKKIMITAGPTYEKIDPVRFIGNYSSGKMGFALAEECARDAAILCAAVADFRPAEVAQQKIKREKPTPAPSQKGGEKPTPDPSQKGGEDVMTLSLVPNPDIAASLGQMKKEGQLLVGFALETNDEEQNALHKLEKKNLDFIVLNSLRNEGTCFQSDENQISIISHEGRKDFPKKPKTEVARDIVDEVAAKLKG